MIILQPAHIPRQVILAAALLMAVWATQLRYPPLSYPHIGQMLVVFLTGLLILLPVWSKKVSATPRLNHPALVPGFLFVMWVLVRWALAGFTARGIEEVGTILWLSVYMIAAYWLGTMSRTIPTSENSLFRWSLLLLAGAGFFTGFHAIWQYHISYEQAYQQLQSSIGSRQPDSTELGLLHHLKLRRVASVFGDPNNLATFSALALCASLELLTFARRWQRAMGALAIIPIFAAVYYTGSRGGLLDVVGVVALFALLFLRNISKSRGIRAASLLLLIAVAFGSQPTVAEPVKAARPAAAASAGSAWQWRSNTVQERIHYLQVGRKMIEQAPLTGLGPGSVDAYFGRFKSPEARESKYLHNWVIQIVAEFGLIGLGLSGWFLGALVFGAWRTGLHFQPVTRAFCVMLVMIVFDALIQVTWNQRELISTFGIVCGFLIAASANPVSGSRFWKAKSAAASALIGAFGIIETLSMGNETAKQAASDFGYARDNRRAESYWRKASNWIPNDSEPYAARASIALQEGRLMQARNLISQALEFSPESASLHVQAAEIYRALGKAEDSDKHLTRALEIYPSHPDYNYRMAMTLADSGRTTQAVTYAQRAKKYNYMPEKEPVYQKLITELEVGSQ